MRFISGYRAENSCLLNAATKFIRRNLADDWHNFYSPVIESSLTQTLGHTPPGVNSTSFST
ncbi:hypothetical protein NIES19_36240 [Anabaena cylindrica PCC 7122]|nr:hypothetical protein NIES19_36240 [Anabaena cylindrica PCC 7122]